LVETDLPATKKSKQAREQAINDGKILPTRLILGG